MEYLAEEIKRTKCSNAADRIASATDMRECFDLGQQSLIGGGS